MKTEFHTKNFALHEFTNSNKANELNISNEVTTIEQLTAIANLTANVLQPSRDIVGFPMTITSGFRCDELNEEVGGVDNSQHEKGEAADIQCFTDGKLDIHKMRQLFAVLSEMDVDQLLYERDSKGGIWVHVSYVSPKENRHMIRDNYIANR